MANIYPLVAKHKKARRFQNLVSDIWIIIGTNMHMKGWEKLSLKVYIPAAAHCFFDMTYSANANSDLLPTELDHAYTEQLKEKCLKLHSVMSLAPGIPLWNKSHFSYNKNYLCNTFSIQWDPDLDMWGHPCMML